MPSDRDCASDHHYEPVFVKGGSTLSGVYIVFVGTDLCIAVADVDLILGPYFMDVLGQFVSD